MIGKPLASALDSSFLACVGRCIGELDPLHDVAVDLRVVVVVGRHVVDQEVGTVVIVAEAVQVVVHQIHELGKPHVAVESELVTAGIG